MMDTAWITAVSNLGLGAVVTIYLVWWITRKLNGKLDRLATALDKLNENMERLWMECIYKEVRKRCPST